MQKKTLKLKDISNNVNPIHRYQTLKKLNSFKKINPFFLNLIKKISAKMNFIFKVKL